MPLYSAKRKSMIKPNKKNSGRATFFLIAAVTCVVCVLAAVFIVLYEPEASLPAIADADGRKKGYYTFLVAGVDDVSSSTDVLMLVSLDSENGKINVVQIPRDTFVNKTVGGYTSVTRVNAIYAAAYNKNVNNGARAQSARHISMKDLKLRLEESLGVTIDHYILVNTKAFRGIVDSIGGVWFDVPQAMDYDDPYQDLSIHLKAGYQLLSGKDAEGLIRFRHGYAQGDIDRVSLRADFLREMLSQVQKNLSVETIAKIVGEVITSVDTSISVTDAVLFARRVYSVSAEDIVFVTLSGATVQNPKDGTWTHYVLNKRKALEDLNLYFNVYQMDIPVEKFDPKGFFTDTVNTNNAYINDYYSS